MPLEREEVDQWARMHKHKVENAYSHDGEVVQLYATVAGEWTVMKSHRTIYCGDSVDEAIYHFNQNQASF